MAIPVKGETGEGLISDEMGQVYVFVSSLLPTSDPHKLQICPYSSGKSCLVCC